MEASTAPDSRRADLRAWSEDLRADLPAITGVIVLRESQPGTRHSHERLLSVGVEHLMYQTQRATYRVSSGSFFQTNRFLTDELVRIVTGGQSGESALDLYAGVGLFSTALAGDFRHIVSVESSQTSSADLSYNQSSHGETVQATTEQYLARTEDFGRVGKGAVLPHIIHKPDLAVVDPPRSGLGQRVAQLLATWVRRALFMSPATRRRWLETSRPVSGWLPLEQLHLVDLFPQTFHLETIVHLAR